MWWEYLELPALDSSASLENDKAGVAYGNGNKVKNV
jgi:hypothetical protein